MVNMLEPENWTHHYRLLAALIEDGFGLLYVDFACLLGKSFEAYCKEHFPDLPVAEVKLLVDWFHANCHTPSCRYSTKNGKYAKGTGASGAYDAPESGWATGMRSATFERSMKPHHRLEAIELRLSRVAEQVADRFFSLLAKRKKDSQAELKEHKANKEKLEEKAKSLYKIADLQAATVKAVASVVDRDPAPATLNKEVDFALHDLKCRIFDVRRTPAEQLRLSSTLLSSSSMQSFADLVTALKKARAKLEADVGDDRLDELEWPGAGRAWVPPSAAGRELLEQAVKEQMRQVAERAEKEGVAIDHCLFEASKPNADREHLWRQRTIHAAKFEKDIREWTWWQQLDFDAQYPVAKAGWEETAKEHFDRARARAPGNASNHLEAVHSYPWYGTVNDAPVSFFLEYQNVCAKVERRSEQLATFLPNDLQHGLGFCKAYQATVEDKLREFDASIAKLRDEAAAAALTAQMAAADLRTIITALGRSNFRRYCLLSHNDKARRWLQQGLAVAAKWEDGSPFVPPNECGSGPLCRHNQDMTM